MPAPNKFKLPVITVNLIPQDPFMESVAGKFLTWSLSVGRYIVIFTELIVILTFLSRFTLDRRLTDLNENIARQKAIIESYSDIESRFTATQDKVTFLSNKEQNALIIPTLNLLEKILPLDVKVEELAVQNNGWSLKAQALSAQGMKQAIDRIVQENPQSTVSVNSVKLDSRVNAIEFELSVAAKVNQTKKTPPKKATPEAEDI